MESCLVCEDCKREVAERRGRGPYIRARVKMLRSPKERTIESFSCGHIMWDVRPAAKAVLSVKLYRCSVCF